MGFPARFARVPSAAVAVKGQARFAAHTGRAPLTAVLAAGVFQQ